MAEKPTRPNRFTGASVPPAKTRSTRPSLSSIWASIMASAPDAQAETGVCAPPCRPRSMATWPAAASGISIGTVRGLTRVGPPAVSWLCCSCIVWSPPMPVPSTTATRAGLMPLVTAEAMAQASRAASTPSWAQRSERRSSKGSRDEREASGTQPAMRTGRSSLQADLRALMPERPAKTPSQVEEALEPRGDMEPQPTIETRWAQRCRTATVKRFWNWADRYQVIPDGSGCHPQS